ncbi:MAG: diguanylate cyclase [Kangiellaceae bacterium]|nr:diguanylate cyclase [Kangiellaceae bacterium]
MLFSRPFQIIFFLVIAFLLSPNLLALNPDDALTQYYQKNWQNTDGLPQNTITSLAQTPDGYLWMGTLEGLVRFDGIQFTHFNTRTTPQIKHNMVARLLVDRNGVLWIATSGGGLTRFKDGEFKNYSTTDGLPLDQILTLFEDNKGSLWIGTDGAGLAQFNSEEFHRQPLLQSVGTNIRVFAENEQGLWIASEKGLFQLDLNNGLHQHGKNLGFEVNTIRSLFFADDGVLWVGTDAGIYQLADGNFLSSQQLAGLTNETVLDIRQDSQLNYWIATESGGLIRLKKYDSSDVRISRMFNGFAIYALLEDAEKNLWLGSHLFGLTQLSNHKIKPYGPQEGLTGRSSRSIYETKDGTLLVGLEGGGVNYLVNGEFKPLPDWYGVSGKKIYTIMEDSKGVLWFGSESGAIKVNPGTGKQGVGEITNERPSTARVEKLTTTDGLLNNIILSIFESRNGDIWLGSFSGGLNRWRNQELTSYDHASGLTHNTVNIIFEDSRSHLWVGTRGGGLYRLDNGSFTQYSTKNGLSDDLVFSLYEDESAALWIGTYGGGLNRFKNGEISVIREAQGLFNDVVHRIIEDDFGYFWMSSNKGIFKVDKKELNAVADGDKENLVSQSYGVYDGMRNVECNGGASSGLLTTKGTIWFPTVSGVVEINPSKQEISVLKQAPIIESFSLDGENTGLSNLSELNASSGSIEVAYTATAFARAEEIKFRYKLVNREDKWTYAGARRTAYYSVLPSGEYHFKVMATNKAGVWIGSATDLFFSIAPQYYESWWFRLLMLSLFLSTAYLFHFLRLIRVNKRNQVLENTIQKRTAELKEANRLLAKMVKEDGLTGILNRRAFNDILEIECRRVQRSQGTVGLMLVDIDYFKQYNDSLGHPEGDRCLMEIANILAKSCNRAGEFVTRYGGDEFAIVLTDSYFDKVETYANGICKTVFEANLAHPGSLTADRVTISIGVGILAASADYSSETLIALSDDALYQAKDNGRNRAVCLRKSGK